MMGGAGIVFMITDMTMTMTMMMDMDMDMLR